MSGGRFDAVLMDFFGTLAAGDVQAVEGVCRAVLAHCGLDVTPGTLARRWGQAFFAEMEASNCGPFRTILACECSSLETTLAELGVVLDVRPFMEPMKRYCQNPPLHEEVLEVLADLDQPVCVVSNADEEDLQRAIRACGLAVQAAVSSESTRSYKPDRRIFDQALEVLGVAPSRCLHVGDSRHSDVRGAAALGMATAWVVREVRIGDLHEGTPEPDYTITSLRELPAILRVSEPRTPPAMGTGYWLP